MTRFSDFAFDRCKSLQAYNSPLAATLGRLDQLQENGKLDALDPHRVMHERNGPPHQPLYLICRTGNRAEQAREQFLQAGYENVVNVEGGTVACEQAGLPVNTGKQAISLERQVRIAAGLLVLVGVMLGVLVHPYFYALPAFVGAGLVFAGVTDTCGMGLLLARMPWNQCGGGTCSV